MLKLLLMIRILNFFLVSTGDLGIASAKRVAFVRPIKQPERGKYPKRVLDGDRQILERLINDVLLV